MKRRKLIMAISALSCTILVAISVIYSWYISMDATDNMQFSITQINSNVVLYEAVDSNYNGVPDTGANNKYYNNDLKQDVAYQLRYYDQSYYFMYLDQRYALSEDSTSNLLNTIELSNVAPTKVYTYKYELINYSGLENGLEFAFEADSTIDKTKLKDFQVRLGKVTDEAHITFTSWTDFTDGSTYDGINLKPGGSSMTIPAKTGSFDLGRVDIWLQIRVKPTSTTALNKFTLPMHRITLSCESQD